MKKILIITAVLFLLAVLSTSVSAYTYNFSSGADSKTTFDKPTQSDEFTVANPYENVRSNKDSAYSPPPYGIFSGDIPTDYASQYHTQDKPSTVNSTSTVTYSNYPSSENGATMPIISELSQTVDGEILPSTSVYTSETANILPLYYSDGSMGTLEFPRFKKTIKVYEGESLENMKLGAGHASSTSAWNGNCAIFAHNRGVTNNFGFLKDMNVGDKITYTTKYGERVYEVTSKMQITETDTSPLAWSADNILSLVTCVENKEGYRWYVTAVQVK